MFVRLIPPVLLIVFLSGCDGLRSAPPLYQMSEEQIAEVIPAARARVPDPAERVVYLGRRNIGQPYEIYLLGEYPFEPYDTDPLYCLQRSDCLTFAEHMYALALSDDWWSFLRGLQRIRYRDGEIGMVTRNHYTIADWNRNNAFLFEDLTPGLGDGAVQAPLTQVCRRARFFKQFGVGEDVPDEPIEDVYVPKDRVPEVLDELRSGDFVNIIRGDEANQWCGHTGLVAIGGDGTVNFLHSAYPTVREEPLTGYLTRDKRSLGIRILRLRPDAESLLAAATDEPQVTRLSPESFAAAVADAEPHRRDWRNAFAVQSYRLTADAPLDAALQADLLALDRAVRAELSIDGPTAFGVLDLHGMRLAMIEPDRPFYAASVGKLAILLAWFAEHPEAALDLAPDDADRLARMIRRSENPPANELGRSLGLETIRDTLAARRYRLYDAESGGLWVGEHYDFAEAGEKDPVSGFTLAANVRQCLRFYLMLEQGRLVSPQACAQMRRVFAAPEYEQLRHKFSAGLDGRAVELLRKSGTGPDGWHLDTARVRHGDRVYLMVGMAHDPAGAAYLARMAAGVDDLLVGADRPAVANSR